jgi:hypothetical protein
LAQHAGCPNAALTIKLLIDECLSGSLVAAAKVRGLLAHYVPHVGKAGWQDYNLVENDYTVVTNNRKHFLREYAKLGIHNGLIVIVPSVRPEIQRVLFDSALNVMSQGNDDIANKLVEVLLDGTVHVSEWASEDHDTEHIQNPTWRRQGRSDPEK